MKTSILSRCGMALFGAAALFAAHVQASPTIYSDPMGDISTNTSTGSGTLDIIKMEVSDSVSDVIFNLTVNGNVTTTTWGNFMIGIANMKAAGATNATGNGWSRPINLIASPTNGMTHWIGSWVSGGGGSQVWTYNGSSWTGPAAPVSYAFGANTNGTSTMTYIVSKASLGVTNGDTISFDAYSSGTGTNDSAIDALSNPNIAINGWSGPYTSSAATGISTYTLSNSALTETQEITFSVDMNVQIAIGEFYPDWGDETFVEWGPNPEIDGTRAYLTDGDHDGIYTGTVQVTSALAAPVNYRFGIEAGGYDSPETMSRSFSMPDAPLALETVFFNNLEGSRNVTFTVDMSVQEALGAFDPNTQNVKVVGTFNGWNTGSGPVLQNQGNHIYSGTVLVDKVTGQAPQYKFYKTGLGDAGYESIGNRTAEVVLNVGGAANPAQVLPVVFFNNQDAVPSTRNVTFSVDMSVQVTLGNFPPTGGTVSVVGGFNGWDKAGGLVLTNNGSNVFSGTIAISGNQGSSTEYKFYSTNIGAGDAGYETIGNRSLILGAPDVAQVVPTVFWNDNPGGTTFNAWSGGQQPTSALVAQYAVGGATSPTSGNGIPSASSLSGGTLTLVAVVRTDDPKLSVTGVTTTDLSGGVWTNVGVTVTNAPDQTGVPSGCTRKIFSVAQDGPRRFLAIHASLAP